MYIIHTIGKHFRTFVLRKVNITNAQFDSTLSYEVNSIQFQCYLLINGDQQTGGDVISIYRDNET